MFDGKIYVNATWINPSQIECISPPHAVGKVKLQTTVLGDQGKSMSEPLYYNYFDRPQVLAIDPPCGPVTGFT